MRKSSKKVIKTRNPVARHNRCRSGFHSPAKYSRKTKYKNEIKQILNQLLFITICIVCYYIGRWITHDMGRKHRAERLSNKTKELGKR